jgi:hypothetical protein
MRVVSSWDVFDTIIGRKCGNAVALFDQMGKILGDEEFRVKRVEAERRLQKRDIEYSLGDIYKEFGDASLADVEWELEKRNIFAIIRYSSKLENDDILVSDMYLSEVQIRELLKIAGISFTGKIFVSCYGKSSGKIWKTIQKECHVTYHIGDNEANDVKKPRNYGINTSMASTGYSKHELFYRKYSVELSNWLRFTRLSTIISETGRDKLNYLEIELNFPFLWACCHALAAYFREKKLEKLYFVSRDGQMFLKMFRELYRDIPAEYLFTSRDCLLSNSKTYFEYLNKRLLNNTALVDLTASCSSLKQALPKLAVKKPKIWIAFFLLEPLRVNLESIECSYLTTNVRTKHNNSLLERLNYADHWHVSDVDAKEQPIFDLPNEYDMNKVLVYHLLLQKAMENMPMMGCDKLWEIADYALRCIHLELRFIKGIFPNHDIVEKERHMRMTHQSSDVIVMSSLYNLRWRQILPWWKSLRRSGFKGEIHIINYGCEAETKRAMKINGIILHDRKLTTAQVVVDRFLDTARILETFLPDRKVILTDCSDIVFQTDPGLAMDKLMSSHEKIIVSSEGIRFIDNQWTRDNLKASFPEYWESFKLENLYNAGSIGGYAGTLKELARDIYQMCLTKPDAKGHDQAAMNILLRTPKYKPITHFSALQDGWCFCAASTMLASPEDRPSPMPVLPQVTDGKCYNYDGELICMFHHYTRNKDLKNWVRRAYNIPA